MSTLSDFLRLFGSTMPSGWLLGGSSSSISKGSVLWTRSELLTHNCFKDVASLYHVLSRGFSHCRTGCSSTQTRENDSCWKRDHRVRVRILWRYVPCRCGCQPAANVEDWQGIPFAEPPLGQLRLKPPVLKTRLGLKTFDASDFGKGCLQAVRTDVYYILGQTFVDQRVDTDRQSDCVLRRLSDN